MKTWHRGPVPFDLIPIYEGGGIDFASAFRGMAEIGYDGPVTVHQAQAGDQRGNESIEMAAQRTASFLSDLWAQIRTDRMNGARNGEPGHSPKSKPVETVGNTASTATPD